MKSFPASLLVALAGVLASPAFAQPGGPQREFVVELQDTEDGPQGPGGEWRTDDRGGPRQMRIQIQGRPMGGPDGPQGGPQGGQFRRQGPGGPQGPMGGPGGGQMRGPMGDDEQQFRGGGFGGRNGGAMGGPQTMRRQQAGGPPQGGPRGGQFRPQGPGGPQDFQPQRRPMIQQRFRQRLERRGLDNFRGGPHGGPQGQFRGDFGGGMDQGFQGGPGGGSQFRRAPGVRIEEFREFRQNGGPQNFGPGQGSRQGGGRGQALRQGPPQGFEPQFNRGSDAGPNGGPGGERRQFRVEINQDDSNAGAGRRPRAQQQGPDQPPVIERRIEINPQGPGGPRQPQMNQAPDGNNDQPPIRQRRRRGNPA